MTETEEATDIERRLRKAFAARADAVTVRDLRPADPPGPHLRRLPVIRWRRLLLPLALPAATAAAVAGYLLLAAPDQKPRPLPPAAPPEISGPATPGPDPGSARPTPAESTPPTATPSPAWPPATSPAPSSTPSIPPSAMP
ncbi:hypothetical protein [Streptomyces sp. NPDC051211]|uniref:hypothetical protein n=1 Tax=Streptomyces sp. NPDC051211 TaxID=3154643 RepID=UPI0034500FC8